MQGSTTKLIDVVDRKLVHFQLMYCNFQFEISCLREGMLPVCVFAVLVFWLTPIEMHGLAAYHHATYNMISLRRDAKTSAPGY